MSKNKKRRGLLAIDLSSRTKLIIAVAATVVIVLAVVIATLMILANDTKPVPAVTAALTEDQKHQLASQEAQRLGDIDKSAQDAIDRGDEGRVDDIYKSALQNESDPVIKTKLIIDDSRLYLYVNNTAKAITIAKTAESLMDDKFLSANWLAQLYYAAGKYSLSAQYYTLAGEWANSPNNADGPDKSYFDQKTVDAQLLAKDAK